MYLSWTWHWTEILTVSFQSWTNCINPASYEYRKMSARKGGTFLSSWNPNICWKTMKMSHRHSSIFHDVIVRVLSIGIFNNLQFFMTLYQIYLVSYDSYMKPSFKQLVVKCVKTSKHLMFVLCLKFGDMECFDTRVVIKQRSTVVCRRQPN